MNIALALLSTDTLTEWIVINFLYVVFVANFITPKFYSREMESARRVDVSDTAKK